MGAVAANGRRDCHFAHAIIERGVAVCVGDDAGGIFRRGADGAVHGEVADGGAVGEAERGRHVLGGVVGHCKCVTLTVEGAGIFHLIAAEHRREGAELHIGRDLGVGGRGVGHDLREFAPVGFAANQIVAGLVGLNREVAEAGVQRQIGRHRRAEVVGLRSVARVPVFKSFSLFHRAGGFGHGVAVSHRSLGIQLAIDHEHHVAHFAVVGVDGSAVKVALGGHLLPVFEEEYVGDCNVGLYRRHIDVV